jgi:hypothetical protein
METAIAASGRRMSDMSLEDLEREWQRVKTLEINNNEGAKNTKT